MGSQLDVKNSNETFNVIQNVKMFNSEMLLVAITIYFPIYECSMFSFQMQQQVQNALHYLLCTNTKKEFVSVTILKG